jgi:hypothetical protein
MSLRTASPIRTASVSEPDPGNQVRLAVRPSPATIVPNPDSAATPGRTIVDNNR